MEVIYEDNHIIAVDKTCREIVQGDKTGDKPLSEMLKAWLKKKYCKPGNVFVGVTHQLTLILRGTVLDDRPIRLAHLTDTKHLVQAREGLARQEPSPAG